LKTYWRNACSVYLVHRAELFTRSADRLRRKAYEHALARRRL
jgi:hypothetical protein